MEDFILKQLLETDFSWPYVANKKDLIKPILRPSILERAIDKQVGGDHYKKFSIQPAEFCHVNNIGYLEATAIKYLCRWKDKGGIQDLDKAIHFIELLKEFESAKDTYKD